MPAPEANAELQTNLDVRGICSFLKCHVSFYFLGILFSSVVALFIARVWLVYVLLTCIFQLIRLLNLNTRDEELLLKQNLKVKVKNSHPHMRMQQLVTLMILHITALSHLELLILHSARQFLVQIHLNLFKILEPEGERPRKNTQAKGRYLGNSSLHSSHPQLA